MSYLTARSGECNDPSRPPQAADPASPFNFHTTPAARGRCCGARRTSSHLMRITAIILTTVLMVLAGCSRKPVNVSITNSSSLTVNNVSLNSDRYAQIVGSLPPGASATFVYPCDLRGWLYFEADGKKFESRGKTYGDYFEISSRRPLVLVVGADLTVALGSGTKSH